MLKTQICVTRPQCVKISKVFLLLEATETFIRNALYVTNIQEEKKNPAVEKTCDVTAIV